MMQRDTLSSRPDMYLVMAGSISAKVMTAILPTGLSDNIDSTVLYLHARTPIAAHIIVG